MTQLPRGVTEHMLALATDHVTRTATPEQIAELERVRPDGTQAGNDPDEIRFWATMSQTPEALGAAFFPNHVAEAQAAQDELEDDREMREAMQPARKASDTSVAAFARDFTPDAADDDDDAGDGTDVDDRTPAQRFADAVDGTSPRTQARQLAASDTSAAAFASFFEGSR